MDYIEINRLHVRTEVGFSPHELGKIQELFITIYLRLPKKAGERDCVEDSINYKIVTKDVLFHVENKRYNIIEAVATDVARICVVRHGTPWVKVMVQKPNALRFSDYSAVIIERCLDDFDWEEVHVSIGSNINPFQNIPKALELLKEKVQVTQVSRAFKTTPVGFKEQEDFINMAVSLRTKIDPVGLKQILTDVERKLGRIRDPSNKSAPRTIDLDISFWGSSVLEYKMERDSKVHTWSIPEPGTLNYAHVIIPLADVTPDFIHPLQNKSLKTIAKEFVGVEDFHSFFPTIQLYGNNNQVDGTILTNGEKCLHSSKFDDVDCQRSGLVVLNEFSTDSACKVADLVNPLESDHPVALITGAAKRLGACIARQLHAAGYNIIIHHNTSKVEATALLHELNSLRMNSASLIQADLSSDVQHAAERIVKECLGTWKRLDVLVNNASQFYPTKVGEVNEMEWNEILQTNLCSPFFLSQAAFPSLKSSRGCIINLTDVHANRPLDNHSVYCISKAGLEMCTLTLAKEFAPYVRVNAVAPGAILWAKETSQDVSTAKVTENRRNEILKRIPMGRLGETSDIACTVEFLVGRAGYITGQVICVDGGRTLNQ